MYGTPIYVGKIGQTHLDIVIRNKSKTARDTDRVPTAVVKVQSTIGPRSPLLCKPDVVTVRFPLALPLALRSGITRVLASA